MRHLFQPRHMNHLLGTSAQAIDKVVKKLFELDAQGRLEQGVFNLRTQIDGISMFIQGRIINGELRLSDFYVLK